MHEAKLPTVDTRKADEPILSPQDRVILVMGGTGVGKSHFIQTVTGLNTGVGATLQSETATVSLYACQYEGSRVIMVDTPGFDDTNRGDAFPLAAVASWLAASYSCGIIPEAVLYVHRITDPRMTNSDLRMLDIYRRLLGEPAFVNTIFVTTRWQLLSGEDYHVAVQRENELSSDPQFFGSFLRHGARLMRFNGDEASAKDIMDASRHETKIPLQIQRELVKQRRELQMTSAGRVVDMSAREMEEFFEITLRQLRADLKQLDERQEGSDEREEVERQIAAYQQRLARSRRDRSALSINFWKGLAKRILRVFQLSVG